MMDDILSCLTYKPGWTFTTDGSLLTIEALGPDCHTGEDGKQTNSFVIPHSIFVASRMQMVIWIRECIRTLEIHEINEWFKLDDKQVVNDHE